MKSAAILTLTVPLPRLLGGCASFRNAAPGDPLEPINRGISRSTAPSITICSSRSRRATTPPCPIRWPRKEGRQQCVPERL